MSRYLILFILNLPLGLAAIFNALVNYKLKKLSLHRFLWQASFWVVVLIGLALTKSIYQFLFSNNLTKTEPLSLFDVIEITGVVLILYMNSRARSKVEILEKRVQDLHQELSIRLSQDN